ncbi:glycosyl transferase family 2 [Mycobacterium sp. BK558]|nr:glycosyl transferase family 2 [Mycobacterium sp. BK558]
MPRLVVTMPAFNAGRTIRGAVYSTLRAMPADSELLVLDDRSQDDTLKVLDSISDKRLRVIAGDTNVGGARARNRLLAESDSEFIASMDADDLAFPWRFRLQSQATERADVVFSSAIRFGHRTGFVKPSAPTSLSADEFPAALLFHCPVWHPSLFARRTTIEAVGGYKPMKFAQDYDLWLRLASSGARLCRLSVPVIAYRESKKQASRSDDYIETVRQAKGLQNSYISLFNLRLPEDPIELDTLSTDEAAAVVERGLRQQLSAFRLVNRLHFSALLRSKRTRTPLTI